MSRSSLGGDSRRLKQIFLNLLSNAIKFILACSRITLDASIEDGGDLSRILLPFEQVEDRMKHTTQGTGLGFALSKSLTELHGGTLSLESEPGVGTTVTLRFLPERTLVTQPQLPLHL